MNFTDYIKALRIFYKHSDTNLCLTGIDNRFLAASDRIAKLCGFANAEAMIGKTNHDILCEAGACAKEFEQQNHDVLSACQTKRYFAIVKYADGRDYLFITEKSLVFGPECEVIGVNSYCQEITNQSLVQFASKLTQFDSKYSGYRHKGVYQVVDDFMFDRLSQREQECLFLLIRGKSSREIGEILQISRRTAETHINNIKNKLGISHKSDIIEFAIENGFLMSIPQKLLSSNIVYQFAE